MLFVIIQLRCCCCGHTSDTFEPIIDLSLEIEDVSTIQCALESFTMVEKMDSKFTCSSCNEVVTMEKQLMLDKAPSVAAFHLKRFKKDGNTVKKVDSHVYFTKDLDLQPYTSANGSDIVSLKFIFHLHTFFWHNFKLRGVVSVTRQTFILWLRRHLKWLCCNYGCRLQFKTMVFRMGLFQLCFNFYST